MKIFVYEVHVCVCDKGERETQTGTRRRVSRQMRVNLGIR